MTWERLALRAIAVWLTVLLVGGMAAIVLAAVAPASVGDLALRLWLGWVAVPLVLGTLGLAAALLVGMWRDLW